jgi:hypothetical protein
MDSKHEPRLINLTVKVDDYVLLHAQWKAMREGTSINGLIAAFLSAYSGVPTRVIHRRRLPSNRPRALRDQATRDEKRRRQASLG